MGYTCDSHVGPATWEGAAPPPSQQRTRRRTLAAPQGQASALVPRGGGALGAPPPSRRPGPWRGHGFSLLQQACLLPWPVPRPTPAGRLREGLGAGGAGRAAHPGTPGTVLPARAQRRGVKDGAAGTGHAASFRSHGAEERGHHPISRERLRHNDGP